MRLSPASFNPSRLIPKRLLSHSASLPTSSYIDSHVHLDLVLERQQLFSIQKLWSKYPSHHAASVAVFCFPDRIRPYQKKWHWKRLLSEPQIYGSFGIHPHYAHQYTEKLENWIMRALEHPKAVAWGEIGLDYYRDLVPRDVQRKVFIRQLQQAVNLDKTIVIHSRHAYEDTWSALKDWVPRSHRVHWHCFTGFGKGAEPLEASMDEQTGAGETTPNKGLDWDQVARLTQEFASEVSQWPNLVVGVTGLTTKGWCKPSHPLMSLPENNPLKMLPLNKLVLESDGPYCSPIQTKKMADGSLIPFIARGVSLIKDISEKQVLDATLQNTLRVYNISLPS